MQFFVEKCNRELSEKLRRHKTDLAGMGTTERVRMAVKWRLEMLIPVMGLLPLAPPPNSVARSISHSMAVVESWGADILRSELPHTAEMLALQRSHSACPKQVCKNSLSHGRSSAFNPI